MSPLYESISVQQQSQWYSQNLCSFRETANHSHNNQGKQWEDKSAHIFNTNV